MKVLVKNGSSGKFLFSAASFTHSEEDALDFESPARAEQFCREHKIHDAQIVVKPRSTAATKKARTDSTSAASCCQA